jgi:MarR family transcriptional regulator, lower aerobic nicotinate degradation pathway regulator
VAQRHADRHREDVADVVDGLRRIVRALHESHRRAEQRWQLSAAQLLVLQRLAEAPTLSVSELANRTFTHQSTVSVVVARLVGRGLVRRGRADDDARRAELALTAAGRALLRRAMSSAQAQLFDALDAMPSTRLRAIASGIHDVVTALGAHREAAGMFFEDVLSDGEGTAGGAAPRRRRSR